MKKTLIILLLPMFLFSASCLQLGAYKNSPYKDLKLLSILKKHSKINIIYINKLYKLYIGPFYNKNEILKNKHKYNYFSTNSFKINCNFFNEKKQNKLNKSLKNNKKQIKKKERKRKKPLKININLK